jgi:hypothetical protein
MSKKPSLRQGTGGHFEHSGRLPGRRVAKVAAAVDDMFRNSPEPTKTESEKAFQLTSSTASET